MWIFVNKFRISNTNWIGNLLDKTLFSTIRYGNRYLSSFIFINKSKDIFLLYMKSIEKDINLTISLEQCEC
jgi:hypothetical protein